MKKFQAEKSKRFIIKVLLKEANKRRKVNLKGASAFGQQSNTSRTVNHSCCFNFFPDTLRFQIFPEYLNNIHR